MVTRIYFKNDFVIFFTLFIKLILQIRANWYGAFFNERRRLKIYFTIKV